MIRRVAIALFTSLALASDPPAPSATESGRTLTTWFYAGETSAIWERFSPEMRQAITSKENLDAFRKKVDDDIGTETRILDEKVQTVQGLQVYTRTSSFSKFARPITVQWAFDEKGTIQGFFVRPEMKAADSSFLGYETKTALHLPFTGEWYVFWGGRTIEENYHAVAPDQRFAYDLVILREGKSHAGDGKANDQYYCFSQPVLAPAAGLVKEAVDGIEDNIPGVMNPRQPTGNHVILDHGNGEFSFLAHFRKGSVGVKPGERVEAGSPLGKCGNSGNSSEPHLHYHLQNNAIFGGGQGLPAQFQGYIADGKEVARGEPTRGQTVQGK